MVLATPAPFHSLVVLDASIAGLWTRLPYWLSLLLHLGGFFVITLFCNGELARRRPAAENLTEFYLLLAVGGAFGGIFNALLAPLLFPGVWEYPIVLLLVCLVRPSASPTSPGALVQDVAVSLALLVVVFFSRRGLMLTYLPDWLAWFNINPRLSPAGIGSGEFLQEQKPLALHFGHSRLPDCWGNRFQRRSYENQKLFRCLSGLQAGAERNCSGARDNRAWRKEFSAGGRAASDGLLRS